MARGGITETEVRRARDSLLARGMTPSYASIRIELGNTGSISTIQKHLAKIDEYDLSQGVASPRPPILSERIGTLIEGLANELKLNSEEVIARALEDSKAKLARVESRNQEIISELDKARAVLVDNESTIADLRKSLGIITAEKDGMTLDLKEALSRIDGLLETQKSNLRHMETLEELSKHSREALEHYRESIKVQRAKEERAYNDQLRKLGVENRKLADTLSLKMQNITSLSSDTARLSVELKSAAKSQTEIKSKYDEVCRNLADANKVILEVEKKVVNSEAENRSLRKDIVIITKDSSEFKENLKRNALTIAKLDASNRALEVKLSGMESELDVKNKLITIITNK
jgi:chromosome segregation ATPase